MFPDSTIVCIGGGPSLTAADVDLCRGRARVVAVNDAYRLAPWADVLYGCDAAWWAFHKGVPEFDGLKFSLESKAAKWPGVTVLGNAGEEGLSLDPTCLKNGRNGGYQAVNLAVLLGAKRIVLLGYDMAAKGKRHWFGEHPPEIRKDSPYSLFLQRFQTLVKPLADAGVDIVNCSRETALDCFRRAPLAEVLA